MNSIESIATLKKKSKEYLDDPLKLIDYKELVCCAYKGNENLDLENYDKNLV